MPLARRLPKLGFYNPFRRPHQVINVRDLGRFEKGQAIDRAVLVEAGLARRAGPPVKLLAAGEISVTLTVRVDAISAAARQKIESAGGRVELSEDLREKSRKAKA